MSRHRHRFEAYLDQVFGFSDLVSALPEGRQFPQHAWKKVFDAVFLGAAMQISSLLQIEAECHHGALAKRIGPISDDTLGYSLERQSPEPVFALSCPIKGDVKRKTLLPAGTPEIFSDIQPAPPYCRDFFFSCLTVLACREAALQAAERRALDASSSLFHGLS